MTLLQNQRAAAARPILIAAMIFAAIPADLYLALPDGLCPILSSAVHAKDGDEEDSVDESGGKGRGRGRGGDDDDGGSGSSGSGSSGSGNSGSGSSGSGSSGSGSGKSGSGDSGGGNGGSRVSSGEGGSSPWRQDGGSQGGGYVARAVLRGSDIRVVYTDGWSETVIGNRYELRDGYDRLVIRREVRRADRTRLKAAIR